MVVHSHPPAPASISIRALSLCPDNCSNRGTCLPSGACQCPAGFSGPSCAVGYAQLIPGAAPITSHLAQFAWDVYSLDIAAGEADVIITTTQSDLHQDVDIYVRYNGAPSRPPICFLLIPHFL